MQQNALFFLLFSTLLGYAGHKLKLFNDWLDEGITVLLLNLCYPALIIYSLSTIDLSAHFKNGVLIAAVTAVTTPLFFITGKLIFKKAPDGKRRIMNFILGVGNINYFGIPVISAFLGPAGVFYAVIHSSVQDFFIWGLYYPDFIGAKKRSLKSIFRNPCVIALLIGILFAALNPVFILPEALTSAIEKIGGMTSPLAMIFFGVILGKNKVFGFLKDRHVFMISALKVLILPAVLLPCMLLFLPPTPAVVLAALFSCPAPIMGIIWAFKHDMDHVFATNCCVFSSILYMAAVLPLLYLATTRWMV